MTKERFRFFDKKKKPTKTPCDFSIETKTNQITFENNMTNNTNKKKSFASNLLNRDKFNSKKRHEAHTKWREVLF